MTYAFASFERDLDPFSRLCTAQPRDRQTRRATGSPVATNCRVAGLGANRPRIHFVSAHKAGDGVATSPSPDWRRYYRPNNTPASRRAASYQPGQRRQPDFATSALARYGQTPSRICYTCAPATLRAGIVFVRLSVCVPVCPHKISKTTDRKLM